MTKAIDRSPVRPAACLRHMPETECEGTARTLAVIGTPQGNRRESGSEMQHGIDRCGLDLRPAEGPAERGQKHRVGLHGSPPERTAHQADDKRQQRIARDQETEMPGRVLSDCGSEIRVMAAIRLPSGHSGRWVRDRPTRLSVRPGPSPPHIPAQLYGGATQLIIGEQLSV